MTTDPATWILSREQLFWRRNNLYHESSHDTVCGALQIDKPEAGLSSCVVSIAAYADVTVTLQASTFAMAEGPGFSGRASVNTQHVPE